MKSNTCNRASRSWLQLFKSVSLLDKLAVRSNLYVASLLKVGAASPDEREVFSNLAYGSKASWGYMSEQLERWKSQPAFRRETIFAWPTLVAEAEAALPVGVVQLDPVAEPWALDALSVHPTALRCGIGRRLLREALEAWKLFLIAQARLSMKRRFPALQRAGRPGSEIAILGVHEGQILDSSHEHPAGNPT